MRRRCAPLRGACGTPSARCARALGVRGAPKNCPFFALPTHQEERTPGRQTSWPASDQGLVRRCALVLVVGLRGSCPPRGSQAVLIKPIGCS